MVTHITEISTPPTPADPPTEFEQKAAKVWSELHQAVPQMNQQASEIEQIGADAQAAKERAIQESDAALGYRNEAQAARDTALAASATAAEQAGQAVAAKDLSEDAAKAAGRSAVEANHILAEASQAIAMADAYMAVPTTFKAWQIVVAQPHLRFMVWNPSLNKYVRAPWHQPGKLQYFLRQVPYGFLEVRSDVVLSSFDFPDLAEYLGTGVGGFTLDETRGEFLRALDSGRGIDAVRNPGSAQGDAQRDFEAVITSLGVAGGGYIGEAATVSGAAKLVPTGVSSTVFANSSTAYPSARLNISPKNSGLPVASENRVRNKAYRLAVQY